MEKMIKKVFVAGMLGLAWAGVILAQAPPKESAGSTEKPRLAVVEFTPGPSVPGMTAEAKRQLQASIAFALFESDRFDVVDVRHTRDASKADLIAVNGPSTAAAVRVGKQLGVRYVLTGTVEEYNPKGSATLKTRLVEVTTGKVKHSGETSQQSTSAMTAGGDAEMKTKVLKPLIQKLTTQLTAEVL
ncbi:hypothetical protein GCM10028803_21510 [Larkinella knui]|uniref:Penicillin-binding protein activator LpoB n=1 Tax=Larkinella knui TaxID=2025310 RepID=A0A3P1CWJ7_9BACT|nr:hypothetical protein [Larkinella knui]RRB17234.1 hypothetical protein EHT87_02825 [Larkinella knui]